MAQLENDSHSTAPLNTRDRQRIETRGRLYEAAIAEFRRVGFDAAQIDRIVAAAEVTRGTFYFHFPTKEHVLAELQRRSEHAVVERLADARKPRSVRAFLTRVIDASLAVVEEIADPRLVRDMLAVNFRQPVAVDPADHPLVVQVATFLAGAAARGELRHGVTAEELTDIVLNSVFSLLLRADVDPEARRKTCVRFVDVLWNGIAPATDRDEP